MLTEQKLKWLASVISVLLVCYFMIYHTGLLLVIIGFSFLVVIGVLLFLKKIKNFFGDGD